MLSLLSYLVCLIALLPAVLLAISFRCIDHVVRNGWSSLGRMLLEALDTITSPPRLLMILAGALAFLVAGCMRLSRPWACLVLGVIGALSLLQLVVSARPTTFGQSVFLLPPILATGVSFWWAYRLLNENTAN
jgi:hypothetical protein